MNDYARLDALERQGDNFERWYEAARQANDWVNKNGTDALVAELRTARDEHRPARMGTANILILLTHIDRLEAELSKDPLVKG